MDTELIDRPSLTPAAQDGNIFFKIFFGEGYGEVYTAMGKAPHADLAGVGGIDDVEDYGLFRMLTEKNGTHPFRVQYIYH